MSPKNCIQATIASFLIVASGAVLAAAGDPPPSSLDLGAAKPKSTSTVPNPGGILPVGQSSMTKKASTDAAPTGATGVGSVVKSPLGTKGVLGNPLTGGRPAQAAQDDPATSNDVVVKMPSNMKK